MSASTHIETLKAKKKHRCSYCWHLIQAGEIYNRYRWFEGGDVGTVKIHPECLAAFNELDYYEQQEGFTAGENLRGCNCGFTKEFDDSAIDAFAKAMKEKMDKKREEGSFGWNNCPSWSLNHSLKIHLKKGDPIDVANFCMMLWFSNEKINLED